MIRVFMVWGVGALFFVLYFFNLRYAWLVPQDTLGWIQATSWLTVVLAMTLALLFHRSRLFFLLLGLGGTTLAVEWLDALRHAPIDALFIPRFGVRLDVWLALFLPWLILASATQKDRGIATRHGAVQLGIWFFFWGATLLYFHGQWGWIEPLLMLNISWLHLGAFPDVLAVSALLLALFLWIRTLLGHPPETLFFPLTAGLMLALYLPQTVDYFLLAVVMTALQSTVYIIANSYYMAYIDELTGLKGRRAMNEYLLRLKSDYTIVMADIDHFKAFNDTHGHDIGDEVLKLVASKLQKVRGGGEAFRWGGEEFVLIFNGRDTAHAKPYVEAVRHAIEKEPFILRSTKRPAKKPKHPAQQTRAQVLHVTMSFGMAMPQNSTKQPASVMKQADLKLYEAKQAGRNCVR